jgi:hypothetical protein
MIPFKRNFLQHAHAVGAWMQAHGATGGLDVPTLQMQISLKSKTLRFYPQFTADVVDGSIAFFPKLVDTSNGFVGWYPYESKVWPAAQDKLLFKQLAAQLQMRVPAWTQNIDEVKGAFLIKAARSSLGRGLRGPFRKSEGYALPVNIRLNEGEYAEQFILGKLLKAWFWNDQLAVCELSPMPYVRGDSQQSVEQLLKRQLGPNDPIPEPLDQLLAWQQLSRASVLADQQIAVVDYRYMASLSPALTRDHNVRPQIKGTGLEAQLLQVGKWLWADMPADQRQDTVYTVDAVVDDEGRVWCLEMNCNSVLHPALYEQMLDGLFGV